MKPVNPNSPGRARAAARWTGAVVVLALLLSAIPCAADGVSKGDGYEVKGEVPEPGANLSVGGWFGVQGKQVLPTSGAGTREFTLEPHDGRPKTSSSGCPCQGLFGDGFESGGLGAWSGSVGNSKSK